MKVGDLVRVIPDVCLTFGRAPDDTGMVVGLSPHSGCPLILWAKGISLFGRTDFLEVVHEGR